MNFQLSFAITDLCGFIQDFFSNFSATILGVLLAFYFDRKMAQNREKKEEFDKKVLLQQNKTSYLQMLLDAYQFNLDIVQQWERSINNDEKGPYVLNVNQVVFEKSKLDFYLLINNRDLIKKMNDVHLQLNMFQTKINQQLLVDNKTRKQIYGSMLENIHLLNEQIPNVMEIIKNEMKKSSVV